MKIGIISDTHDNLETLGLVLRRLKEKGVTLVIHCGDYCRPRIIEELGKFEGEVHGVFGNMDFDRASLEKVAERTKNFTFHGIQGEIEIEGKHIVFVHRPEQAKAIAERYDLVFHGHTHSAGEKMIGKTHIINPGEIAGQFYHPSYAVYDTEKGKVEIIRI